MSLNKEEILAQKASPQVHRSRLHWPLVVAALPFFGVVAAFGIAPDTVPDPIELQHVVEDIALPSWPAPWDAAAGILSARGWNWRDKLSLLRAATAWHGAGFRCDDALSVAELTRSLTPRVRCALRACARWRGRRRS